MIDLAAYRQRIGHAGALDATVETLRALHAAHATTIIFENLDPLFGRIAALDPMALERKLVHDRRGGYCFEHNLLFKTVLEALGFAVTGLAARVRLGAPGLRPRSHALLRVDIDNQTWIADVGFGALGLLDPLPLIAGPVFETPLVSFRLRRDSALWVVEARWSDDWNDLYAFGEEAYHQIDYEVAHYYTASHPSSPFVNGLMVQRIGRERRLMLRNNALSILDRDGMQRRRLASGAELADLLADAFGLSLPAGCQLPATLFA